MITCHIPSVPNRALSLQKTVNSIIGQVDKLYISLNGYEKIPNWIISNKIHAEILDNSLTDGAKWLHCWDESAICVHLDDDLIVPQDFVRHMLDGYLAYGGAVSLHGKIYGNRPITHYKRNFTLNYRCLGTVHNDVPGIDVIGTGCMLFDNEQVKKDDSLFEYKNMADVLFSRLCHQQNIPMTVLAHKAGWLMYMPQEVTIWRTTPDDSIQTRLINEFLK